MSLWICSYGDDYRYLHIASCHKSSIISSFSKGNQYVRLIFFHKFFQVFYPEEKLCYSSFFLIFFRKAHMYALYSIIYRVFIFFLPFCSYIYFIAFFGKLICKIAYYSFSSASCQAIQVKRNSLHVSNLLFFNIIPCSAKCLLHSHIYQ